MAECYFAVSNFVCCLDANPVLKLYKYCFYFLFFSFPLYPALSCQREPENLVLRHSIPIKTLPFPAFRPMQKVMRAERRNWTPRSTLLPQRNENIKYLISSCGNRTHDLSSLQLHAGAHAATCLMMALYHVRIQIFLQLFDLLGRSTLEYN